MADSKPMAVVEDLDALLGAFDSYVQGLDCEARNAAYQYVKSDDPEWKAKFHVASSRVSTAQSLREQVVRHVRVLSSGEINRLTAKP
jgi:hypothetical protein